MKYTNKQREDAAVEACAEWLKSKWGQHYGEMMRYLPELKGDEVRLMLQQAIRQVMSRRPNELVTMEEVNRQYCNLLDSHKLDLYENLMELFKDAAQASEAAAAETQKERDALAKDIAATEEQAAFQKNIADRAAANAANKKVDIKELRRRALFTERNEQGRIETTPMPASIQIFSRSPKQ